MKRQEAIRFPGQKCRSFGTFLVLSSLVIILTAFGLPLLNAHSLSLSGWILSGSIALTAPGLFLWIWLNTHYRIDTPLLKINCGSLAWQIPIETITTIRLNQKTVITSYSIHYTKLYEKIITVY